MELRVEVVAVMTAGTGGGSGVRSDVLFAFFDCASPLEIEEWWNPMPLQVLKKHLRAVLKAEFKLRLA